MLGSSESLALSLIHLSPSLVQGHFLSKPKFLFVMASQGFDWPEAVVLTPVPPF